MCILNAVYPSKKGTRIIRPDWRGQDSCCGSLREKFRNIYNKVSKWELSLTHFFEKLLKEGSTSVQRCHACRVTLRTPISCISHTKKSKPNNRFYFLLNTEYYFIISYTRAPSYAVGSKRFKYLLEIHTVFSLKYKMHLY